MDRVFLCLSTNFVLGVWNIDCWTVTFTKMGHIILAAFSGCWLSCGENNVLRPWISQVIEIVFHFSWTRQCRFIHFVNSLWNDFSFCPDARTFVFSISTHITDGLCSALEDVGPTSRNVSMDIYSKREFSGLDSLTLQAVYPLTSRLYLIMCPNVYFFLCLITSPLFFSLPRHLDCRHLQYLARHMQNAKPE